MFYEDKWPKKVSFLGIGIGDGGFHTVLGKDWVNGPIR